MSAYRHKKEFYSINEVANLIGVSQETILKNIKAGKIRAARIGENVIVSRTELPLILDCVLSDKSKKEIIFVVKRLVDEYGETLKLLGKE